MNAQRLRTELSNTTGVSFASGDRAILISSGSWADVGRTALSVYDIALRREIELRVRPATIGLNYWQSVKKSSSFGIALCWLQNFPALLQLETRNLSIRRLRPAHLSDWRSYLDSFRFLFKSLESIFRSPVNELADRHIAKLEDSRKEASETIGRLLNCWTQENSLQNTISQSVYEMGCAVGINESLSSDETDVLTLLQAILDLVNKRRHVNSTVPRFWIRYWPALLVGAVSGLVVLGSWRAILNWLSNNVIETARSGFYNWIYEPLYQIYLTVRHDPNSRIALMGQDSLESDLDSLQRMVIQFARDNCKDLDEAELRRAVRIGDLSPIMRAYENELRHPFKSLMNGTLIRSILIQVQKTKVDAEIAVSGINQLIQAQQLVFGIVAALPALAVVFFTTSGVRRYVDGSSNVKKALRSWGLVKDHLMTGLGDIESIALDKPQLDYRDLGQIYCTIVDLKAFAARNLRPERSAQFAEDLDRIVAVSNSNVILDALMRMYAKY